eukprot:m51a1_g1322 putative s-adenosylmethionine:trna ribosyltransferase-isomerase (376) ;mRNA; f:254289-255474
MTTNPPEQQQQRPQEQRNPTAEREYLTADFDFDLPPSQIAQEPASRRDCSRLLVLDRSTRSLTHSPAFHDVLGLFRPGDALVLNETRVFPARLVGRRSGGGVAEVLLLHPAAAQAPQAGSAAAEWVALVCPGQKLRPGKRVVVADDLAVDIVGVTDGGDRVVRLVTDLDVAQAIEKYGRVPLPPYMQHEPTDEDRERYQTVYAREKGSVAAPTAGLHFTQPLLEQIEARGVRIARLVLHVGAGTFKPVAVDDPRQHHMHSEWYRVPEEAARVINETKAAGGRVWAIGTTSVRTLETVADESGVVRAASGWTSIFIRPGYRFKVVDAVVTNFHLPKSTLLMLVSAFAGYDFVMDAYRQAVKEGYRFYSYGDAMAIY